MQTAPFRSFFHSVAEVALLAVRDRGGARGGVEEDAAGDASDTVGSDSESASRENGDVGVVGASFDARAAERRERVRVWVRVAGGEAAVALSDILLNESTSDGEGGRGVDGPRAYGSARGEDLAGERAAGMVVVGEEVVARKRGLYGGGGGC